MSNDGDLRSVDLLARGCQVVPNTYLTHSNGSHSHLPAPVTSSTVHGYVLVYSRSKLGLGSDLSLIVDSEHNVTTRSRIPRWISYLWHRFLALIGLERGQVAS